MPKLHPTPVLTAVAACVALAPTHALAGHDEGSAWTLGGFGTLSAVHSSEKQADFSANPLNPGQAGATRDWSFAVDSRLATQLAYNGGHWSAVLQVVSERNLTNSWKPVVEWANVQYQASPELSLRFGRIALPLFLSGDYRKASYALTWVRTPIELYGALPISNSDGIDASYRWKLGDVKNTTQVLYGSTQLRLSDTQRAEAHHLAGVSNTSNIGALTVRATALKGDLQMKLGEQLFTALRQFGPQGEILARRYEPDRKRATVLSIGASYDPGQWFVMAEAGRVNARSLLGDKSAGYISGGYRFGSLTPYATFSKVVANTPTHVDGLDLAALPPPYAAAGQRLNRELNSWLSMIAVQDNVSAGLRWDAGSNVAVKFQYDHVRPRKGTSGTLENLQPGYRYGRSFGLFSAALDFVF
ncbi:porin [Pseudoduganella sp. OTU4001]|uniref:porin n=1 Tax=Pseudoduganella sp. OTU4001 TaxID=3043854 RepID=UPI00313D949D